MIRVYVLHPVRHPLWKLEQSWYPVSQNRRSLKDMGLDVRFHTSISEPLLDCDVLCLSSTYFRGFRTPDTQPADLEAVARLSNRVPSLLWFDMADSSSNTTFEVLPYVRTYLRRQLFTDRSLYSSKLHMNRIWCDYFHKNLGLSDDISELFYPLRPEDEVKLNLSWNLGMEDFRRVDLISWMYYRIVDCLGRTSTRPTKLPWHSWKAARDIDLVGFFAVDYVAYGKRAGTVEFQRRRALQLLDELDDPSVAFGQGGLSPREYYAKMRRAKIALSLFGWGELCWREYEAWICGAAVMMPDVSHVETWPDFYRPYETYWPLKWDMSDLVESFHRLRDDEGTRLRLAQAGQEQYRPYWSAEGQERFALRFKQIIENAMQTAGEANRPAS